MSPESDDKCHRVCGIRHLMLIKRNCTKSCSLESPPSPLLSRAKPRDLQFCRPVLEMFLQGSSRALRPVEPALSLSKGPTPNVTQPGRAGDKGSSPTLSERRRRGTLSPQSPSVLCRKTFPGRACRTADPSTFARDDKGKGGDSMCIRWMAEIRAGPPLRCASVGMTIYMGRRCGCPRKIRSERSRAPALSEVEWGFAVKVGCACRLGLREESTANLCCAPGAQPRCDWRRQAC